MNIKEIKELIQMINSSDLAYFEVSSNDTTIKMDKSLTRNISDKISTKSSELKENATVIENTVSIENDNIQIKDENIEEEFVKSPMVGTFYSSPSPEKDNFVSPGDKICKGSILCIIEAMKLMNEIESEVDGEIIDVLVKNGEMVEYGQELFKIRRY